MKLNSPTTRLALWYTLIIMCISLFFSATLYNLTVQQIGGGLRHQIDMYQRSRPFFAPPFDPSYDLLLQAQLTEIRHRIGLILALLNGAILLVSGSVSYLLARRTLRPIEESLDAQRRFTADASHELRTPLTAMRTEIEVSLRGATSNPKEYETVLKSTLEEIERLENLSRALLRLAQHEELRRAHVKKAVSANDIIATAYRKLSAQAKRHHIELVSQNISGTVLGDDESLVELFVILIDNAIKYSPENTKIEVTSQSANRRTTIAVRDHGIGIHDKDLAHIFERFYRAEHSRSKTTADGSGLGLSIAQQIVDRHHGTIQVASQPGKGTTMSVTLPEMKV